MWIRDLGVSGGSSGEAAACSIQSSTNIREVKQSAEKAPTRAFSLLKPTSTFTVKYLRDYT